MQMTQKEILELVLFSSPPKTVLLAHNDNWIGTYRSLLENHGSVYSINRWPGRTENRY